MCRTTQELATRRSELGRLQTLRIKLRQAERGERVKTDRDTLLSTGGGRSGGGSSGVGDSLPTRDMSVQQMQERTETEIKAQDALLDQMSRSLDNLKAMGTAIGEEADLHSRLLDDLEAAVDAGDEGLRRETERTKFVIAKTSTCWLYTTICLLLLVLIVLVVVKWH